MSGIGFSELIILFVIGLIVLGPERLPRVANQLGRWIGQARRMTRVMKRQLEDELDFDREFDVNPPDRTRHANLANAAPPAPPVAPAEEHDDTYSPAHDADSPGTGVDTEPAADDAATKTGGTGDDGADTDDRIRRA